MLNLMPVNNAFTPVSSLLNRSLPQAPRSEPAKTIQFTAVGDRLVAAIDCKVVGSICFNSCSRSDSTTESQKTIFKAAYAEYESVQKNKLHPEHSEHPVHPEFVNAQYIEALKEIVLLDNGEKILVEKSDQGNRLVHKKVDGQIVVEDIHKAESIESALDRYMGNSNLKGQGDAPRINDSRSLGVVIKTGHSTISIGAAEEKASIQSVSKIFADITLHLCEHNLYRDKNDNECAIFNMKKTPLNVPKGYSITHREAHTIPVDKKYSEYEFNDRKNLTKERHSISKTTTYSIPNASNNYGALTTTGRIPSRAIIDGVLTRGQSNIVKVVMEGVLGYSISINDLVLKGELDDTRTGREKFIQKYREVYLPRKERMSGKNEESGEDWLSRKVGSESEKLPLPDNHTRAVWLMGKGVFENDLIKSVSTIKNDPDLKGEYSPEELADLKAATALAEDIMKEYTRHCAFDVSCEDLAALTFVIASNGCDPQGNNMFDAKIAEEAIKQMEVGGLYSQSNKIDGIKDTPFNSIKSGVGGFLTCAIPKEKMLDQLVNHSDGEGGVYSFAEQEDVYRKYFGEHGFSITTLARPLNEAGNSANGLELIKNVGAALSSVASSAR